MKTSTAVILIAVITCCNIEVDSAFSFNLSGAFNPGITFGVKSHSRQWKYQLKNNRYEDSDWPQPGLYNVPEYVSKPIVSGTGSDNAEKLHTQKYGSNHRNHRY